MNEIYEVKITRYINGQRVTTTMSYDTYKEALEYAKVTRKYPYSIKIIHRYEVEEVVFSSSK